MRMTLWTFSSRDSFELFYTLIFIRVSLFNTQLKPWRWKKNNNNNNNICVKRTRGLFWTRGIPRDFEL